MMITMHGGKNDIDDANNHKRIIFTDNVVDNDGDYDD